MPKYLIITSFEDSDLGDLGDRSESVKKAILEEVPVLTGKWSVKLATKSADFHTFDVVDSPTHEDVIHAAAIIERLGRVRAEVLPVVEWDNFISAYSR